MKVFRTLFLLSVFSAAQAATPPGDRFTHFAGFDLGKGTLTDIQEQLGSSRVRERGDAGEYEAWICYSTPRGEVQFNSGEMGGGTDLLGFTISKARSAADCPKANRSLPIEIAGVRLGISKEQFSRVVGVPIAWDKNTGTASFESRLLKAGQEPIDVSITVIGTFTANRLTKISVWKIETV